MDDEVKLPAVLPRGFPPIDPATAEVRVRANFWAHLRRAAGRIPFAEDLVAAYVCARDPKTPTRVKAVLVLALAYFVTPADLLPDILLGLGFTDDATVLATAIAIVGAHIKPRHAARARAILQRPEPEPDREEGAEERAPRAA